MFFPLFVSVCRCLSCLSSGSFLTLFLFSLFQYIYIPVSYSLFIFFPFLPFFLLFSFGSPLSIYLSTCSLCLFLFFFFHPSAPLPTSLFRTLHLPRILLLSFPHPSTSYPSLFLLSSSPSIIISLLALFFQANWCVLISVFWLYNFTLSTYMIHSFQWVRVCQCKRRRLLLYVQYISKMVLTSP